MGEAVDISRCEDKAATQLKGIGPKFVLMVAGRASAIAALEIVAPKHESRLADSSQFWFTAPEASVMLPFLT